MDYWQKQSDKPLFPDIIWSRPENKRHAGKLLIIGGQSGEFSHVATAFEAARKAGAGHIRVLLPESLRKVAAAIAEVEFAPANKSGGFAKTALASWFDLGEWADHIILAGDFGKNSETTTIIDGFLLKNTKSVTLSLNSLSSIGINYDQLLRLPSTLIIDKPILQKIGMALGLATPIKSTTPIELFTELIHQISMGNKASLVIQDEDQIWVAIEGDIVSTKAKNLDNGVLAANCAVWLMQNPHKPLEALATACFEASNS